ncbi:MAG TPA: hypothetical protein VKZ98_11245 [Aquaticitalea sp.]|nr:hypothetical protein [Aquaticitalea sp.]
MKTISKTTYVEWLNAEEMHEHVQQWMSELEFANDEFRFLEDLIKTYTLQLIESKQFSDNKEIIDAINRTGKRNHLLLEAIRVHSNELEILMDGIDQPKDEESYKERHRDLILRVKEFLLDYRSLKTQLFSMIQSILKKEKQRLLLDRR